MQHRRADRPRALRLGLTALGLLLGMLAMHAVGGGPHGLGGDGRAMGPAAGDHATAASQQGLPAALTSEAAMVSQAAVRVVAASAGSAGEVVDTVVLLPQELPVDASGAMAAMCVVMLLSLFIALAYGVVGRPARRATARVASRPAGGSGRPLRAPPPDLLSQLCVLRT